MNIIFLINLQKSDLEGQFRARKPQGSFNKFSVLNTNALCVHGNLTNLTCAATGLMCLPNVLSHLDMHILYWV